VELALLRIAEHRAVIGQAKGMLMLITGCDADGAFALLRRYSQQRNVKLNEIAHRLVESVSPLPGRGRSRAARWCPSWKGSRQRRDRTMPPARVRNESLLPARCREQ